MATNRWWMTLVASLLPTSVVGAQQIKAPVDGVLVQRYELVGIRLGMPADAAVAALTRRGYRFRDPAQDQRRSCDYACEMSTAVTRRRGGSAATSEGVVWLRMFAPNKQFVEVRFASSPRGQIVRQVAYEIGRDQISREAFKVQADTKFGPSRGSSLLYCFPEEPECLIGDNVNAFPSISDTGGFSVMVENPPYGYNTLVLREGRVIQIRRDRQFAAELERQAPRNATPNF